jgi:hypothetical protein
MEYTLPVMKIVAQESNLNKINGNLKKFYCRSTNAFHPQNQCDGSGSRSVKIITDPEGRKA